MTTLLLRHPAGLDHETARDFARARPRLMEFAMRPLAGGDDPQGAPASVAADLATPIGA